MILICSLIEPNTIGSRICAQSSTRLIVGVEMNAAHEVGPFAVVELTEVVGWRMLKGCFDNLSARYLYPQLMIILTLLRCPTKHTGKG